MHSINLRELRNAKQLKAWLAAGEAIELCERGRVIGQIVPAKADWEKKWPDFEARHKEIFGDRVFEADHFLKHRHRDWEV